MDRVFYLWAEYRLGLVGFISLGFRFYDKRVLRTNVVYSETSGTISVISQAFFPRGFLVFSDFYGGPKLPNFQNMLQGLFLPTSER